MQLLELEVNNPNQIKFVSKDEVNIWEYKGGSKELDEYMSFPGLLISGILIFKKFIWCRIILNPETEKYLVFNAKYFKYIRQDNDDWNKYDIDLSDNPITLNNIEIIG